MKKLFLLLLVTALLLTTASCSPGVPKKGPNESSECEVVFQDFDGSVLKTEKVNRGNGATPPVGLKRDGYKFVKWDTAFDKVNEDLIVKAVYEEIKSPTLITDTVYAKGRDVAVKVCVAKNPGILTLLSNTIYIENAMQLTKIESGSAMEGYTFVGPKTLSNACNAAWYSVDVPERTLDGEVAVLHFRLNENVAPGAYEISVSCDNGAFDADYKEVPFENIKGYIIVDSAFENEEEKK